MQRQRNTHQVHATQEQLRISPITVHSSSWKKASKAWSTFQKCLGQRKTSTQARSSLHLSKSKSKFSTSIKRSAASHLASSRFKATLGTISPTVSRSAQLSQAKFALSQSSASSSVWTAKSTAWLIYQTCLGTSLAKKPFRTTKKAIQLKPKSLKSTLRKNVSLWASNSLSKTQPHRVPLVQTAVQQ